MSSIRSRSQAVRGREDDVSSRAVRALAEDHIMFVMAGCENWADLAPHGAPYWRPRSAAELRRKIAATAGPQPATDYSFVIEDDGRLVGECSLHGIDWRSRVANVGVCIWSPADRHQGFGCFGAEFVIDWALQHLGMERLEAWINDGNEASLSLFAKLGFTHEATLRQRYLYAGHRVDMHVLGLMTYEANLSKH